MNLWSMLHSNAVQQKNNTSHMYNLNLFNIHIYYIIYIYNSIYNKTNVLTKTLKKT